MNRIRVIAVGKTKEAWIEDGIQKFRKRLMPYTKLEEKVLGTGKGSEKEVKDTEAKSILETLDAADYMILLDERGTDLSSVDLSKTIEELGVQGISSITFVIGGAYGVSDDVRQRANKTIRLSSMTFTHQMIRVILMEQLYRAFSILRGEKYHH